MGQRFQSVFILPSVYMNPNNPNNRNKKVVVFHNQWLYGYTALKVNLEIMKRLKKAINHAVKNKKQYAFNDDMITTIKNHHIERFLDNAIKWAGLQEINNERDFFNCGEFEFKGWDNLGEHLSRKDNNNGFFICEIDENLKLSYGFINGLEDETPYKIKGCIDYLKLFYTDEQIKEINLENKNYVNKIIKGYKKFDGLKIIDLKEVVKSLNRSEELIAKYQ